MDKVKKEMTTKEMISRLLKLEIRREEIAYHAETSVTSIYRWGKGQKAHSIFAKKIATLLQEVEARVAKEVK